MIKCPECGQRVRQYGGGRWLADDGSETCNGQPHDLVQHVPTNEVVEFEPLMDGKIVDPPNR